MNDIADMNAVALARAIRAREISPVEAIKAALDRIAQRAKLNAFITVAAEQALEAAEAAERKAAAGEPLGPLHGVPFSVKDLTNTVGVRTTMGSAIFEKNVPKEDAVAVARAKAAGAILIGKTTTPEFGHKQSTDAPIFGRTLNPIDERVTCGASSGGAAVAVAAGMGPLALGTDGGGSIRIPAACCGVVGLKATLGAVANLQPPDLFSANSYVGPIARDVADTALLFEAIAGPDFGDPYGQAAPAPEPTLASFKGVRVAWLERCGNRLDSRVAAATSAAVKTMEALGAIVEPIEMDFVSLEPAFLVILESGVASRVAPHLARFAAKLDPHLVETVLKGLRHSAIDLQNAGAARSATFRAVQRQFERFDFIVSPVLSTPPLPLGPQLPDGPVIIDGEPSGTLRGGWYPYTFPFNLTGHPAIALPCAKTQEGLPIALQIVGRWHADRRVLAAAGLLEAALR
ncbi:MAG TPA: amidase family protein [Roseiarcus sp.]|jgi:aspartyl-tRNA(Asn)/glutamyl-tRNA(Gln) amidotransferase subunit A